ncbi:MAG: hypothetical protein ABEH81_01100 [Halopenitus sp.]
MTRIEAESEWHEHALDSDEATIEDVDYAIELSSDRASTLTTYPKSISYSPEVKSAKRITLNTKPHDALENKDYLEGTLTLMVDGEIAFEGDIRRISTSQEQDSANDYQILAFSQGQLLNDIDTEESVNNRISYDYLGKLVDLYNDISGTHYNLNGTNSETLSGLESAGGRILTADGGSGTATYSNVGSDASALDTLYVKFYTSGDSVTAKIISNNNTYSESFTDLDANSYGEWVAVRPGNTFDGDTSSYDIEFTLNNNALLINWSSIENEVLTREVLSPSVSSVDTNQSLYSVSGQSMIDKVDTSDVGVVVDDANDIVYTRHVAAWDTSGFPSKTGDNEFIGGEGTFRDPGVDGFQSSADWTFGAEDDLQDWGAYFRLTPYEWFIYEGSMHRNTIYDNDWNGTYTFVSSPVYVNSESIRIDGSTTRDCMWVHDRAASSDWCKIEGRVYLNGNHPEIGLQAGSLASNHNTQDGYGIQFTSTSTVLVRYDGGSSTSLDSVASRPADNEWVYFDLQLDPDGSINATVSGSSTSISLAATDSNHTEHGEFFARGTYSYYLDALQAYFQNSNQTNKSINLTVDVNGTQKTYEVDVDEGYRSWGWEKLIDYSFGSFDNPISGTGNSVFIDVNHTTPLGIAISGVTLVHKNSNWDISTDFDVNVHTAEGHLNYPYRYATQGLFGSRVTFLEEVSDNNIDTATTSSTIANTNNPTQAWGPQQVIGINEPFPTVFPNATSVTDDFAYPGVSHRARMQLSPSGSLRNTATPREGYKRMELSDYSVTVDTNDLSVLFDRSVSGNNLSAMSSIADDTDALFRFEGSHAKIFQLGDLKTNVDLRSETIKSTVSSEDAYSSVEVIGLHNVRSGVFQSSDAPSWLDRHKVIRDDSIETKEDAVARALSFLRTNGDIQYSGEIKTLPTFAPIGELLDGSYFDHGQDMTIRRVRYSKNRTTIKLGYEKNVGREIVNIESGQRKSKGRQTDEGMRIPVGKDNV